MNDTHPKIETKMVEMARQRSNFERLRMGCSMYDCAKELVIASILEKNPRISQAELKREVFLRFYGGDFDEITREKILKG